MSVAVWSAVWRTTFPDVPASNGRAGVSRHALKLVMLRMADHAHDDGAGARPSLATIATATQISRGHVPRVMRAAVELGYLEQTASPRQHRPAEYRVCLERLQSARDARTDGLPERASGAPERASGAPERAYTRAKPSEPSRTARARRQKILDEATELYERTRK